MKKSAKKLGGHGKEHAAAREIAERSRPDYVAQEAKKVRETLKSIGAQIDSFLSAGAHDGASAGDLSDAKYEAGKLKIESTPGVEPGKPVLLRTIASELDGTAAFPSLRLKHPLAEIFDDALAQATRGKGNARHGQGRDSSDRDNFLAQDWAAIATRHGPAFLSGQAEKKLREALSLGHAERRTELLGVLVYVAMLVIHHDKTFR